MGLDIVYRNAEVFDGSGRPPTPADVGVEGERITDVGTVTTGAAREVDATGLALSPGFIDVHTHDDFAAILHPDMGFKSLGTIRLVTLGAWHETSRMAGWLSRLVASR